MRAVVAEMRTHESLTIVESTCERLPERISLRGGVIQALTYWFCTSVIVVLGVSFGGEFLRSGPRADDRGLVARFAGGDGRWYRKIAERGYSYRPGSHSSIGFFPAYPVAASCVARASNVPIDLALVIVTQVCLVGAFVAFGMYIVSGACTLHAEVREYALLSFGLLPTTMFFRMAYAESMFVLLIALVLYGIRANWPVLVVVLLAGFATATRPVGVAIVAPVALYAWREGGRRMQHLLGREGRELRPNEFKRAAGRNVLRGRMSRLFHVTAVVTLSCWGLLGFVAFQEAKFGEPLAFVKTQRHVNLRDGEHVSAAQQLLPIASFQPIWANYVPARIEYWARYEPHVHPVLSLQFANPIYFVTTAVLVIVGWRKRWLGDYEVLLSAGLLLIPYITKSYDNAMASFGRFSAVVLPAYVVLGHLLYRLGPALTATLLAFSAFMLGAYSAMFAAGYRLL